MHKGDLVRYSEVHEMKGELHEEIRGDGRYGCTFAHKPGEMSCAMAAVAAAQRLPNGRRLHEPRCRRLLAARRVGARSGALARSTALRAIGY